MTVQTPEAVLQTVTRFFKSHGITHAEAAERMGIKSKQTLSNLLSSKKYLTRKQAARFNTAFDFSIEYLMTGFGQLIAVPDVTSPILERYYKPETKALINEILADDIRDILNWTQEAFRQLNNQNFMNLGNEMKAYVEIPYHVRIDMRDFQGSEKDYEIEFKNRVFKKQCEIIDRIEAIIFNKKGS